MKKIIFVFITVFVFSLSLYAAGSKKAQTSNVWQGEQIPSMEEMLRKLSKTGGFVETPCFIPDADTDFFACTGVHQGRKNQNREEVKAFALASAVDVCSMKIEHRIMIISDEYYVDPVSVGDNFLAVSNTAQVSCVKYSVENGIVTAYVGIKVPKKEFTETKAELQRLHNPAPLEEKKQPKLSEEEKQMIEMIEKRLKEAEEKDNTEQRKKK